MPNRGNTTDPMLIPGQPLEGPASYPFPKSTKELLPWSFADERLTQALYYWLGTTRPNGRPHATPLWGVWLEGAFYFDGSPETQWARNIAQNQAVTLHLERGDEVVIMEGDAADLTSVSDTDLAARIVGEWDRKYGRLHPDPIGRGLFRLTPKTARAWSTPMLTDGTSWHFAG